MDIEWRTIRPIFIHLGYLTVRSIFVLWVTCWRCLNGTHSRIRQRSQPQNYRWSAHVQDVVYRYKYDFIAQRASGLNFLLVHNRFDHPDTILRDNVTLYGITETEALFVETDEDVDVTLMETSGFVANAQFQHAKRVIEIPITSFHRLAKDAGDPSGEVVFLTNTARCGSTLLTQFFEETEHCLCYSEPEAISILSIWMDELPEKTLEELLLSCIRLMCKPRVGKSYDVYVIKLRALANRVAELCTKAYPKTRHLFAYRDCAPVARSMTHLAYSDLHFMRFSMTLTDLYLPLAKYINPLLRKVYAEPEYSGSSFYVKNAVLWAVCCSNYLRFRQLGMHIAGTRYEDLVADPLKTGRAILTFLNLPEGWAEKGIRALNKDSQRQSPISRVALSRVHIPQITTEDMVLIDGMCKRFKLPSITEKCVLENTISG